mmetsp:Transcript_137116/g.292870  ORF Transcript_137116/g.292870 Transcript_137116/m.292870 type:complete len:1018 (+) Transcript_137116:53-3106(+)
MIASGELFLLNGETSGELQPLPAFLNQNIRVIAANFDRAYVACEPPACPPDQPKQPCTVWCFQGDGFEPEACPEFEVIEGSIRQIAIGEKHLLVLTHDGKVYSRGTAVYGSAGHGGARDVPEFKPVPALQGRKVKLVACGPYFSIAITHEGDVFSWGQAFHGETGLFSQVEAVPRFAPLVTQFKVTEVSCGNAHVLARTEAQQCVSWGENTCGQLGLGQKSKPTYKPQLLDSIPSRVLGVSAGWAHSSAVGTDGRAYAWGLNSHGQLGLGDTKTRLAPHLLHELVGAYQVESVHCARALTVFRTADHQALLCGQVPSGPDAEATSEFAARTRHAERDNPTGCMLSPVPLTQASTMGFGTSQSELSEVIAFDRGAIGFARSTVYRVAPNLAPVEGGTQVQAYVTGLPFERPGRSPNQRLIQDMVPVKVRLKSSSPLCDVVVPGKIVDMDTVEFTTPNVGPSPLGSVVEHGSTTPVQLRVSIDDGFTWTPDRYIAPTAAELDKTMPPDQDHVAPKHVKKGCDTLKGDFEVKRRAQQAANVGSTVLWYCRLPRDGPVEVTPMCAPVTGGTEVLIKVELPARMPTDTLTVKFACKPLYSLGDPELEGRAPMRRDASEIVNPCRDELAKLPLVGALDVPVCAWLDPSGEGVRCISPPIDAECVSFYDYAVELSLDGRQYLSRALPFSIFDLRVTDLVPNTGSLLAETEVRIGARGLPRADVKQLRKVRIDFPKDLRWPSRVISAKYDYCTEEIYFNMPSLSGEVKQRVDEMRATTAAVQAEATLPEGGSQAGDGEEGDEAPPAEDPIDPNGGLGGLEVFVELSLNGQNFTEDRISFTYHPALVPSEVRLLSMPEGFVKEEAAVKEDPKAKKGGKGAVAATEEPVDTALVPGAKVGCATKGISESAYAVLRVDVMTKVGEEDMQLLKAMDLPASVELLAPPVATPDSKAGSPTPAEEAPQPVETLTAVAPSIRTEDVPEGALLFLQNFQVSLNGQYFVSCPAASAMRLEPLPPETEEGQEAAA